MAMPEVSETDADFAIIVYREDERWDAEVLPEAVTEDLNGLIRALRQQPSIAGTIGFAGVADDFFVAVRVIGSQVSVLLSDIAAAAEGDPLAISVLEYLDLDEMDLAAISSNMEMYPDEAVEAIAARLGFGPAMERALDIALGG